MNYDEIFKKIYYENDFGRSVAIAASGAIGLSVYLLAKDTTASIFSTVIAYPIARIISDGIYEYIKIKKIELKNLNLISSFSNDEKLILIFFVKAGGACVSWGYVNKSNYPFPRPALNSLMERGIVRTSVMEDGMTESFVLSIEYFDLAQKYLNN